MVEAAASGNGGCSIFKERKYFMIDLDRVSKQYENGQEKDDGLSIVKVYKFNDTNILPIPTDIAQKTHRTQLDLFNFTDE